MITGEETLEITKGSTPRGFDLITFKDLYDKECSLQMSSIATAECIWLGAGDNRMHLNREQAGELANMLMHFWESGSLPRVEATA